MEHLEDVRCDYCQGQHHHSQLITSYSPGKLVCPDCIEEMENAMVATSPTCSAPGDWYEDLGEHPAPTPMLSDPNWWE